MHAGEDAGDIWQQAEIADFEWPVDKCSLADDILARHKAPLARIRAIAAIIAHHEVSIGRNDAIVNGLKRIKGIGGVDV